MSPNSKTLFAILVIALIYTVFIATVINHMLLFAMAFLALAAIVLFAILRSWDINAKQAKVFLYGGLILIVAAAALSLYGMYIRVIEVLAFAEAAAILGAIMMFGAKVVIRNNK